MKAYLKHKILNLVDIKELTAIEHLDFEGKYKNYVEKHDFWELCFVEKGDVSLTVDEKKYTLNENSLILISPNKKHSYHSHNGNKNKAFVICFQCFSHALRPLSEMKFDSDGNDRANIEKIMAESKDTFCMNKEDLLEVVASPVVGGQQMIILLLECLLINLIRTVSSKENSDIVFLSGEDFYRNLVDTVIVFLRENINKKISLDEICAKFSYSKSFLCKTFKSQTGDTLISYFNKIKVEEAKKLLESTNRTVTDISYSLGFQEIKYFDYIFKKYTGTSPAVFRKTNA